MKPSPAQILQLADAHIRHFTNLLSNAPFDSTVSPAECRYYLALWAGIKVKNGVGLAKDEMNEVMDAVWSGDYDEMLGISQN